LGEIVGDLEPPRLGAHEYVLCRTDAGDIDQRSHRDVHERTVPHDGEEEGAAGAAPCVVEVFVSEDGDVVQPLRDRELLPLDAGKRLEGGAGRRSASRAVTVRRSYILSTIISVFRS
jgi:hypothetical protein